MRVKLRLPDGIDVKQVACAQPTVRVTVNFDQQRVLGFAKIVEEDGQLFADLDFEAAVAVQMPGGECAEISFVREPAAKA